MPMFATLSSLNLFSSLPTNPPPAENPFSAPSPFKPPIPIPKYPKPLHKSNKKNLHQNSVSTANSSSKSDAFKTPHRNTKYFRPVKEGQVISSEGSDRAVVIGDSGLSYLLPGAPFEFKYSYSETPKAKPLAIREPAFLPFAPPTMNRPWTGKAPLKKSKQNIPLFQSLNEIQLDEAEEGNGEKDSLELRMEMLKPFSLGRNMEKSRKGVLGEPLRKAEIKMMIQPYLSTNRQVNLGRDGLTHNMLELIHSHWRREKVCKVRCKGIPTVDMDNVCYHLEKKTGGKIIHRVGGVVYLFRGRNYDYRTRPQYPVMLWKPAAPVYPKLIQAAPEGLTKVEADELRKKGQNLLPICKLAKNGVYISLVKDVRNAFEGSQLVKIDCEGMHASDYKKLGAKLKELVPCVLLSFDDEQILMWRGHEWKSMYRETLSPIIPTKNKVADHLNKPDDYDGECLKRDPYAVNSSPKMTSLWKGAVESSKALLLDEINLGPDALLKKVNEFEDLSQAALHSYPATVSSGEDSSSSFDTEYENSLQSGESDEEVSYSDDEDEDYDDEDPYDIETDGYSSIPIGSLRVDHIAERLTWERKTEQ